MFLRRVKNFSYWCEKASKFHSSGNLPKALESYEKALKFDANNITVLRAKIDILTKLWRPEELLETYNSIIELDQKNIDYFLARVQLLLFLERYEEAFKVFPTELKLDPKNVDAWLYKGKIYMELKRYTDVFQVCDELLKLGLETFTALSLKIEVLCKMGSLEEALKICENAIEYKYKDSFLKWKGDILCNLYRYEEALQDYEKITKTHIFIRGFGWCGRQSALFSLGRYDEALKTREEVNNFESFKVMSFFNNGFILVCQNEFNRAVGIFAENEKTNIKPIALLVKGFVSFLEKEFSNARRCFEEFTLWINNIENNDFDFLFTIYLLGNSLIAFKENTELGEQLITDAELTADRSTVFYFLKGLGFIALDDLGKAKDSFEQVLTIVPDHKPAKEQIARIAKAIEQGKKLTLIDREKEISVTVLKNRLIETDKELEKTLDEKTRLFQENNELKKLTQKKNKEIQDKNNLIEILRKREETLTNAKNQAEEKQEQAAKTEAKITEEKDKLKEKVITLTNEITKLKKEDKNKSTETQKSSFSTFIPFYNNRKERSQKELAEVKVDTERKDCESAKRELN